MDKISDLKQIVIQTLDLNKAQDIISIDLKDKSSMADYMIIASGTPQDIFRLYQSNFREFKDNGIKTQKLREKIAMNGN